MSRNADKDGEAVTAKRGPGRPRILTPEVEAKLVELVTQKPQATTRELGEALTSMAGRPLSHDTVAKALKRLGISKVRAERAPRVPPARRYGYTAAHRRPGRESGRYPSSTMDVEWAVISDLFEKKGPGKPETYPRRQMFDAMSYVVRSGCAWRLVPGDFPPWHLVYATFRRWSDAGLFEKMNDRMRDQWREREGRAADPTAAVIDSQSVRTAEKGGSTVSTATRKSTDERDT